EARGVEIVDRGGVEVSRRLGAVGVHGSLTRRRPRPWILPARCYAFMTRQDIIGTRDGNARADAQSRRRGARLFGRPAPRLAGAVPPEAPSGPAAGARARRRSRPASGGGEPRGALPRARVALGAARRRELRPRAREGPALALGLVHAARRPEL